MNLSSIRAYSSARKAWIAVAALGAVVAAGGGISAAQSSVGEPSSFVPTTPVRIVDTRIDLGGMTLGPGSTVDVVIGGIGAVPSDATGAMLNVTVVNGTQPSWLAVWPSGEPFPGTSNLNWADAAAQPNLVSVALGANGAVSLRNSQGYVDVVVDLAGYYVGSAGSGQVGPQGPAGPTGPQGSAGPTGPGGPAGAFSLEDANGNAVPGRVLGLNPVQGQGVSVIVIQDDDFAINYDLQTGQTGFAAPNRVYASTDCTGPELYDINSSGAPTIPNLLFTDTYNQVVGSPLYSIGSIDQNFAAGSQRLVDDATCTAITETLEAVTRVPYGAISAPPPGPLKIVG